MKTKLLLLSFLIPSLSFSESINIDGISYNLVFDVLKAEVISSEKGYSGDINIPPSISYNNVDYQVYKIGDKAFKNCYNLTSVRMPNCITSIGEYNQEIKGETNVEIISVIA